MHLKTIFLTCALIYAALLPSASASIVAEEYSSMNFRLKAPIVYTKNLSVQESINSAISPYIVRFRMDFDEGKFFRGEFSYEVKSESEDFLSLILIDDRYMPGSSIPNTHVYGLVFDKRTGERLPLEYFVLATAADIEGEAFGGSLRTSRGIPTHMDGGKSIRRIPTDYFLPGDGTVAILFQPFEITSAEAGAPYVLLTEPIIEYFSRKNS